MNGAISPTGASARKRENSERSTYQRLVAGGERGVPTAFLPGENRSRTNRTSTRGNNSRPAGLARHERLRPRPWLAQPPRGATQLLPAFAFPKPPSPPALPRLVPSGRRAPRATRPRLAPAPLRNPRLDRHHTRIVPAIRPADCGTSAWPCLSRLPPGKTTPQTHPAPLYPK